MIVRVEAYSTPASSRRVRVADKERTVSFEGEMPEDIALLLGQRKVAFFEARVDTQRRISLGRDVGWMEW